MDKKTEMSIRISQKSALMSRVDKTNGQVPSCCVKLLSICPSCPFGLMMDKSIRNPNGQDGQDGQNNHDLILFSI